MEDKSPFLSGHWYPCFVWISGDVSSGFESQGGQAYSHLAEAYVLRECAF